MNSVILLKEESAIGTSEQLQALQSQAEVSKVNSVILLKDANTIGVSGSEQSQLCIFIKYVSTIGARYQPQVL